MATTKYKISHDEKGELIRSAQELQQVMMAADLAIRDKFGVESEDEEPEEKLTVDRAKEVVENAVQQEDRELFEYMEVKVDHEHHEGEHEHGQGELDLDLAKAEGVEVETIDD